MAIFKKNALKTVLAMIIMQICSFIVSISKKNGENLLKDLFPDLSFNLNSFHIIYNSRNIRQTSVKCTRVCLGKPNLNLKPNQMLTLIRFLSINNS